MLYDKYHYSTLINIKFPNKYSTIYADTYIIISSTVRHFDFFWLW